MLQKQCHLLAPLPPPNSGAVADPRWQTMLGAGMLPLLLPTNLRWPPPPAAPACLLCRLPQMLGLRVQRHFISNMSNAVPVFFDGLKTAGSYTSGQVATDGSDVRALALLTMLAVFEAVQLRGGAQLALVASAAALLGVLLWAALRSESYRRYRTAITAAVRLVCAAKVLAAESFRLFDGAPEGASLSKAAPHFVMLLAWESGALLLSQVRWVGWHPA